MSCWTIYLHGLNKGLSSRFCVGSKVKYNTPEESRRTYRLHCCEYNNEDEENNPNILSDKKMKPYSYLKK